MPVNHQIKTGPNARHTLRRLNTGPHILSEGDAAKIRKAAGMAEPHPRALAWFRITLGIGMAPNALFALLALFAPRLLETAGDLGTATALHWPRTAGALLLIVTVMYVLPIMAPSRYLPVACILIAGRLAVGCLFLVGLLFMDYPPGARVLAAHDIALPCVQFLILWLAFRPGTREADSVRPGRR